MSSPDGKAQWVPDPAAEGRADDSAGRRADGRSVIRAGDSAVRFTFEGRSVAAREGDTVAAALFANGVRVFGRSSKYHRPRGYRCGQGHCSACAMRVNGLPGVRTCVTPVRAGMTVEREHAWPEAGHDLLRAAEAFAPLMPPGFYYRRFRRSPKGFALFERAVALAAGQGALPSPEAAARLAAARCERRDAVDVLVVGGGVAGMSAALAAAEDGAGVLLVEQDDRLGGRLAGLPVGKSDRARDAAFPAGLAKPSLVDLKTRIAASPAVETLTGAAAIGWYEEGVVAVDRRPDLLLARPAAVVLASGAYDIGLPFAGWDLPGVMLATGALRLLERHDVKPGTRAVVLTTDDHGYETSRRLASCGVEIACVADCRPTRAIRHELVDEVLAMGARYIASAIGARAHGRNEVSAVTLLHGTGEARAGDERRPTRVACDLLVLSAAVRPADDLAYQATAKGSLVLSVATASAGAASDAAEEVPSGVPAGLWLAGLVAGARTADEAVLQGTAAGSAAARHARAAADPA